ncbi:hypothetical protein [Campylobacter sp. 19-13652]|uniref:hypothetical protein n=1 Tax=Campylobacter sp. 19-13652 TaxID=2840180 RepID=UPI001C78B6D0|nr:hypothetical protein [Campylobacter sp. 19-13652]BCX78667.1 hypothetical protein LBC_01290 [Campylobacter sp. 19-13652]
MKYTQQDKARILRITSRTLQRWKSTKPELYAIIEAGFILREGIGAEEEALKKAKELLREALPTS